MMLVECIPNFSEGRSQEVIHEVVEAITSVKEVLLLDVSSDSDHNRTVVTFAAPPEYVGEAAFRGIETASRLIDLDQHVGVHPRIGAADVVPFVPLRNISIERCVEIAHDLGQRVGQELNIPVYLYEYAAVKPERKNLAEVRRYRYETLKEVIQHDPERLPDFGPGRLGKAGATAIGVREPLIAFNAYLDTNDVEIAIQVARAVRESSGGLPYVKALGLLVDGFAQVSMNVIDYRLTPLSVILERVRDESAKYNVRITHTELVGLIPQAALLDAAVAYLQLPPSARQLILDQRVGALTNDYSEIQFK